MNHIKESTLIPNASRGGKSVLSAKHFVLGVIQSARDSDPLDIQSPDDWTGFVPSHSSWVDPIFSFRKYAYLSDCMRLMAKQKQPEGVNQRAE